MTGLLERRARLLRVVGLGDAPPAWVDPAAGRASNGLWLTDYAEGRLRGFIRIFARNGSFYSYGDSRLPAAEQPRGTIPSLEEWAAFDAESQARQVYGGIALLRKNATPQGDLLDKIVGNVAQVTGTLDRFLPGWSVLLNGVAPLLPIAPLLSTIISSVGSIGGGSPITQLASSVLSSAAKPLVTPGGQPVQIAPEAQRELARGLTDSLASVAQDGADALAPLRASVAKLVATYDQQRGDLLTKLEATGREALSQATLAVSVAAIVATGGAAAVALQIANAALLAARAGLTVADATRAAKAFRELEQAARDQANRELAALAEEERLLADELARLKAARSGSASPRSSAAVLVLATVLGVGTFVLGRALR